MRELLLPCVLKWRMMLKSGVMCVLCSSGLSIHTFHGNFFVRSTDLLSLANVNPDAGFAVQMSIEENLLDLQTVSFQAALLYTSSKGNVRLLLRSADHRHVTLLRSAGAVMWRSSGQLAAVMWRSSGQLAAVMWRSSGQLAAVMWRSSGQLAAVMWRSSGQLAAVMWRSLCSSVAGERRIRVHTLCLPVVNSLSDIFAGADVQAITALLASMGTAEHLIWKTLKHPKLVLVAPRNQ